MVSAVRKFIFNKRTAWILGGIVVFMTIFGYIGHLATYSDMQLFYRSAPLTEWVNNEVQVGDNGKTLIKITTPVCTPEELATLDSRKPLTTCHIVAATVPLHQCPHWWIYGDCVGIFAPIAVLKMDEIRERITKAVMDACKEEDTGKIDLSKICLPTGELKTRIILRSLEYDFNREKPTLEFIIE